MSSEYRLDPKTIHLSLKLGLDLNIELLGEAIRFKSTLIGADPNTFLLIKIPQSDNIIDRIHRHQLLVRYMFKGSIHEFKTTSLHSVSNPIPAAFLLYPSASEVYELRSHERFECFLPARIKSVRINEYGAILDISEEGVRIAFRNREFEPRCLMLGEPVRIITRFPNSQQEEEFSTDLRRIFHDGERVALGLFFSDLDPARRSLVSNFIAELKMFS